MDDDDDLFEVPDDWTAECPQCRVESRYSLKEDSVPCISCDAAIDTSAIRKHWTRSMEILQSIIKSGDEEAIALLDETLRAVYDAVHRNQKLEDGFLEKRLAQLLALAAKRDTSIN